MHENFTDRARQVMQLANQEAQRFNHEYIGTEHILLGLVKEGSGVAARVLKNLNVDLRKIHLDIELLVQSGPDMVTMGKLPQTSRAKKVIQYSMEEARNLNQNHVGTEHILLGLLREQEGVAAHVLMNLGLKLEEVREAMSILTAAATVPDAAAGAWKAMNLTSDWVLSSLSTKRTIVEQVDDLLQVIAAGKKAGATLDNLREVIRDDACDDLLAACGWLFDKLTEVYSSMEKPDGEIEEMLAEAKAAIARATSQPEAAKK